VGQLPSLAIPLAIRSWSHSRPRCHWLDDEPDPTCGDALRRHRSDGSCLTRNRKVEGSDRRRLSSATPAADVSRYLIIPLIIRTIRRDPSGPDATDGPSHLSSQDPSGADQIDAEHQATDLAIHAGPPSAQSDNRHHGCVPEVTRTSSRRFAASGLRWVPSRSWGSSTTASTRTRPQRRAAAAIRSAVRISPRPSPDRLSGGTPPAEVAADRAGGSRTSRSTPDARRRYDPLARWARSIGPGTTRTSASSTAGPDRSAR